MKTKVFEVSGSTKDVQPLPNGKSVIYTLHDLAEMFQVTIRTIYNWLDDGRFSFVKIGAKTYITEQQLQEFLTNHQVKSFKIGRNW
ncbi:MAG: helix-turn-helix domain-containing protein [Bacteroidota bacterium]